MKMRIKNLIKIIFMLWISDRKGVSVAQARLTMTALDWSNFGQFVHDEIISNTCLGKFYKEGITNAVDKKETVLNMDTSFGCIM